LLTRDPNRIAYNRRRPNRSTGSLLLPDLVLLLLLPDLVLPDLILSDLVLLLLPDLVLSDLVLLLLLLLPDLVLSDLVLLLLLLLPYLILTGLQFQLASTFGLLLLILKHPVRLLSYGSLLSDLRRSPYRRRDDALRLGLRLADPALTRSCGPFRSDRGTLLAFPVLGLLDLPAFIVTAAFAFSLRGNIACKSGQHHGSGRDADQIA